MQRSHSDFIDHKVGSALVGLLVVILLAATGLYFILKGLSRTPSPGQTTPENKPSALAELPLTKTQEATGSLLPGLPTGFPTHDEVEIVSSYIGTVGTRPAYGAVWMIADDTVFKVMEYHSEELAETWIFDSPPDEDNTSIQTLNAHLKDGQSVSLTVAQPAGKTEVSVKADFIL